MPIAVKLSKTFYDRFGDDVVGELVGMLNQVDAASQDNLREINERNGVRFDALEQQVDRRFADADSRFERLEGRLERIEGQLGGLRAEMANHFLVHTRWMIGMWVTVLIAVVGLWFQR